MPVFRAFRADIPSLVSRRDQRQLALAVCASFVCLLVRASFAFVTNDFHQCAVARLLAAQTEAVAPRRLSKSVRLNYDYFVYMNQVKYLCCVLVCVCIMVLNRMWPRCACATSARVRLTHTRCCIARRLQ